ncbi:hypothetical protein U1Q18_045410 [Sarracenia purpurea var. burkii]
MFFLPCDIDIVRSIPICSDGVEAVAYVLTTCAKGAIFGGFWRFFCLLLSKSSTSLIFLAPSWSPQKQGWCFMIRPNMQRELLVVVFLEVVPVAASIGIPLMRSMP